MKRCAIYARCSTRDHQADSIPNQVGEAKLFVQRKGWVWSDEHVFIDEGVSRAEFHPAKRRAFHAMLDAAKRGEIDALVVRDETRLGGDAHRVNGVIIELAERGVAIFTYANGEELKFDSFPAQVVVTIKNLLAQEQRARIAAATRENHEIKAREGLCTGGRVYGYAQQRIVEGKHTWVDYRIDSAQSPVVLRMFENYRDGDGFGAIAKKLNDEGVPSPCAGKRGTGSWSHTAVRTIILNERYRGVNVWGREGGEYRGGTWVRVKRPESKLVVAHRPDLQIVPDDLWSAVVAEHERRRSMAGAKGRHGPPATYLLSGLMRCANCGGPMNVVNRRVARDNRKHYACAYHHKRGASVCNVSGVALVERVDDVFVSWIEEHVLREQVIVAAMEEARARLAERTASKATEVPALEAKITRLGRELRKLADQLAATDDSTYVVDAIKAREVEKRSAEVKLATLQATSTKIDLELRRTEKEAKRRLRDLRAVLRRNPREARKVVEALLQGPLKAKAVETPEGRRLRITGAAVVGPVSLGTMFTTGGDPSGNRTRVTGVRGRCPNR